jgi:hypothetical protein
MSVIVCVILILVAVCLEVLNLQLADVRRRVTALEGRSAHPAKHERQVLDELRGIRRAVDVQRAQAHRAPRLSEGGRS